METMEKRPLSKREKWLMLGEGLLCLLILAGSFLFLYKDISPLAVWELDGSLPPADLFVKDGGEGVYCGSLKEGDWTQPGWHLLMVEHEGQRRLVVLHIEDTTAPRAQGLSLTIGIDEELTPDQCISQLVDEQLVAVSFVNAPLFHEAGEQEVEILLEDLSGNQNTVTTTLTILGVQPQVVVEAGEEFPAVEGFLPNDTLAGAFITDVDTLSTAHAGLLTVEIEVEGEAFTSHLLIEDTVAPQVQGQLVYCEPGKKIEPEAFIASCVDATDVTFAFETAPDWEALGYQTVSLTATDEGGNVTKGSAAVFISPIAPVTVEATGALLTGDQLGENVYLYTRLTLDTLGTFELNARKGEEACKILISVVDTTAPVLEVEATHTAYLGYPREAESFVKSGFDATGYTCTFETEPDWTLEGEQTVTLLATDEAGNVSKYPFTLTLKQDDVPPEILYVQNLNGYIGESVSYLKTVVCQDNCDGTLPVQVDTSGVDIYKAGTYTVVYRAQDAAGNVAESKCTLTLVEARITEEQFEAAVNACYDSIITEDMNLKEKGYAIFQYTNQNIRYKASSDKKDWKYEAWRGITTGRGDCFTFCSVARALLEKAGADVQVVTRYGGKKNTRHWWLLVDLGTGYYHFDAINVGPKNYTCFMRTTAEVLKRSKSFWSFNQSLYPATPTEPFSMEE